MNKLTLHQLTHIHLTSFLRPEEALSFVLLVHELKPPLYNGNMAGMGLQWDRATLIFMILKAVVH